MELVKKYGRRINGSRRAYGPGRAVAAALCALLFSACGGAAYGAATGTANKNGYLQVKSPSKKSLANMEAAAWNDIPGGQNCGLAKSAFAPHVGALIEKINPFLAARAATMGLPPVAVLLNNPPHGEGQIGVYLCAGLTQPGYTVHRSVFFNADFIDALNAANSGWDGEAVFQSALAFVLYHELGHAVLGHSAAALENGGSFGPPEEIAADQFAYDAMVAAGIGYDGVELARYQMESGHLASASR